MSQIFFILALLAALGVAGILFSGIFVMAKGGETDKKHSNKLMRLRLYFQGAAVVFLLLAFLTASQG